MITIEQINQLTNRAHVLIEAARGFVITQKEAKKIYIHAKYRYSIEESRLNDNCSLVCLQLCDNFTPLGQKIVFCVVGKLGKSLNMSD